MIESALLVKDQNSLRRHVIEAQFRVRIEPVLPTKNDQDALQTEFIFTQPVHDEKTISSPPALALLTLDDLREIPLEKRLEWITAISRYFLGPSKKDGAGGVRDIDLILKGDGSIENLAEDPLKFSTEEDGLRGYPARYQIPKPILDRIDSAEEKVKRTELFCPGLHFISTDFWQGHISRSTQW
jgi:hypothetical protein